MSKSTESVKVVVRCRPLNGKEQADGRDRIVDMDVREGQIRVRNPKSDDREPPKAFTFDQVYDWNTGQTEIFDITARPIIDAVLDGYNGTIFAYGQTGTGKSHTMEGRDEPPELRGIIPNTFEYVFRQIADQSGSKEFLVRVSYLEIYNEEIRDLLAKDPNRKLELKETVDRGVYVKDLMQFVVKGPAEMNSVLQVGKKNRQVGATAMNQDSSRSHSIFTITVECTERFNDSDAAAVSATVANEEGHIRVGKLNLVDLAGSERQSKTGATGDRLKEGIKINLSLTALGNVISALVDGKSGHIPYRDSKLTRLLQDSLGGNTKTVMIANVGPADWNFDETLSTLRYANRAKNIQNKPRINEDPKDAMLREFQEEIAKLKAQLQEKQGGGNSKTGTRGAKVVERVVEVDDDSEVERVRDAMRKELEAKMKESLSAEALQKAKDEAEARARAQLEEKLKEVGVTEEQRKALKEALKKQHDDLEAIAGQLAVEAQEREALAAKITAMESKVLHGGVNLLDKVDELKKRSEDTKRELEIQRRQEEEQRRRLQELEIQQMDFNEKFSSLEEEIAVKTRKLKKLYEKYQAKKGELVDLQEQFQREREDLLEDYRALTQQIKLKNLVIACFIPPEYQDRIMQHCHWQDYDQTWSIDYLQYAGNHMRTRCDLQGKEVKDEDSSSDTDKLHNVYFSYQTLDDELATAGASGSSGRPSSAKKNRPKSGGRVSAVRKSGGSPKKPTDIGSLRDSVPRLDDASASSQEQYPSARGLVHDTRDPRRRASKASG